MNYAILKHTIIIVWYGVFQYHTIGHTVVRYSKLQIILHKGLHHNVHQSIVQ